MSNPFETYTIQATMPEYHFQSTSTCAPVVGYTSYTATADYGPAANASRPGLIRRAWGEEDPEGPELGVIDTPVGDVPWIGLLLLFAVYMIKKCKKMQKNAEFICTFAKKAVTLRRK